MINLLATILVWLTALYLISFALVMLLAPDRAKRFLGGLANSAFTHYLELGLRLITGLAILLYAPQMLFSNFFVVFGWILVVTTVVLFAVPWQWHRRFAQWGVPYATRNLWLVAGSSFVFGAFVIAAVIFGSKER
ncbi:MAG: hypothetical protein ACR2H6_02085 [Pyrinomonadaceae bacterium]